MKKFLTVFLFILFMQNVCLSEPMNVSFVYINGSNNNNEKMKNWYERGVRKLHPMIKKKFETNKDTKSWYDQTTGLYYINPDPVIFFWGDKSKNDLAWVKEQVDFSKTLAPTIAYRVRSMLTAYLHDAIWVQKAHNMGPVLDNLNQLVISEYEKGNKVALFGYSAGTFITYQYLFKKLPYLNSQNLLKELNMNKELQDFVQTHPQNDTCISAIEDARIGIVSESGDIILDTSNKFKDNYLKLNDSTKRVCAPPDAISSVTNFASPLVLFYSDIVDPNYKMNYYQSFMIKYIFENGIAFLTINFREDPLGFPTTKNLTVKEFEQVSGLTFNDYEGIIYDNSRVWSKRSVLNAHTSYWAASRIFSDAIVQTLAKGMKFNYDEKYQQKMLKKRSEDFVIWW